MIGEFNPVNKDVELNSNWYVFFLFILMGILQYGTLFTSLYNFTLIIKTINLIFSKLARGED